MRSLMEERVEYGAPGVNMSTRTYLPAYLKFRCVRNRDYVEGFGELDVFIGKMEMRASI